MKLLFVLSILFCLSISCRNGPQKYLIAQQGFCDTILYSLNENYSTAKVIDSILDKKNIQYCNLKFSDFHDTLTILFMVNDSGVVNTNKSIPSNRFLQVKERNIKILSSEDFLLKRQNVDQTVISDPNYIAFQLEVPQLNVIKVWRFPP